VIGARPVVGCLVLYALLSALDLGLSWWLIRTGDGLVYEANPLTGWLLHRQGWFGLSVFKGGSIFVVGGACVVLARRRPRAAAWVLAFACLAVGAVVLYSAGLAAHVGRPEANPDAAELVELRRHGLALEGKLANGAAYRDVLWRLACDLAGNRLSLAEAARRLEQSQELQGWNVLPYLRQRFHGRPDIQCLATVLIESAVRYEKDTAAARKLCARLEAEFLATYGKPAPPIPKRPFDGTDAYR
jgi:hypothetical protein